MIDLKKEFKEVQLTLDELIELMPERTIEYFLISRMYKSLRGQGFNCEVCIYDCAVKFGVSKSKVEHIVLRK